VRPEPVDAPRRVLAERPSHAPTSLVPTGMLPRRAGSRRWSFAHIAHFDLPGC
jgi:hypothetical protein